MAGIVTRMRRAVNLLAGAAPMARRALLRSFDHPAKERSIRLLFVASFEPGGLKTIRENIEEWCSRSRFRFELLNLSDFPGRGGLAVPGWLDLRDYSGIVVHCTASYNPDNLASLDRRTGTKLADYKGLKILMKQDEHYRTSEIADYVRSRGFDLLITMTEPDRVRELYPEARTGTVEFMFARTGYISAEMRQFDAPPLAARPIDVGYRGSMQPLNFGKLAYEKLEIGERFAEVCRHHGFAHDISSRWEDRFLGDDWMRFLCRSKATLGVETGASIVDFDGEVERRVAQFQRARPSAPFRELHDEVLRPYEDNAYYKAISPRHFEAAACKTVQVMYEGRYAGVFQADRHYIPLRRDFSNIDDVVRRLRDLPACQDMVNLAFEEIVMDPQYSYEAFVRDFDVHVDRLLARKRGAA